MVFGLLRTHKTETQTETAENWSLADTVLRWAGITALYPGRERLFLAVLLALCLTQIEL